MIPLKARIFGDASASPHLVTREEQRKVVDYAFKKSRDYLTKRRFTVAVRGSPGIGKRWSGLLYIRKLLTVKEPADRRPILFEHGASSTQRTTFLLMPILAAEDQQYSYSYEWVAYRLRQPMHVPREWTECRIIDLVVDPAQFDKGVTPVPSLLVVAIGHCFIPVSPDDRHLGGAHKTSSLLVELVLGPWSLKELQVGFPYMVCFNPTKMYRESKQVYVEAVDTMTTNYYVLGGLPRYLVKDKAGSRRADITPVYAKLHAEKHCWRHWSKAKTSATRALRVF